MGIGLYINKHTILKQRQFYERKLYEKIRLDLKNDINRLRNTISIIRDIKILNHYYVRCLKI